MDEQEAITQIRAAKRFGVSERTIRRWGKAGLLSSKKILNMRFYSVDALDRLVGIRKGEGKMEEIRDTAASARRHPDIFTGAEALEYLHRPGEPALLETLREKQLLTGWKLGKEYMYHRDELDAMVVNGFPHVFQNRRQEARKQPEKGPRLRP